MIRLTDDTSKWQPMETAPRDGSHFDVLCRSKDGIELVVRQLHYGPKPMGRNEEWILWGPHNFLSPFLTPIGWRPEEKSDAPNSVG